MTYIPRTQTITRGTIKRVETRLQGLRSLGGWTDIFSGSTGSQSTPPIRGTGTNQQIGWEDFLGFLRGGQLKIEATQFAEGMNRLYYGMDPGCTDPVPNIPVVPNNSSPRFCASSVAGMIERCRIYEAGNALNSIKTQFLSRINNTQDPAGQFIGRWWTEFGIGNDTRLRATISSAGGTCGITGEIPKLCTAPQVWSSSQLKCVYPGEDGSGGGVSTVIMFGIIGIAALFMFMKR